MIEDISVENGELIWRGNGNSVHASLRDGSYINDDKTILIMNGSRDEVIVLDGYGNQIGNLSNSDSLYLMYLQKHPRFGLSVVASLKDQNGDWIDKYLSWKENGFEVSTNSR